MASTYTQPPYPSAPPNQQYPVDQNMHAYVPPSQPQLDPPQPWPQQQSMQPMPAQPQYQQPPYPTPQYPPQQQQQLQPAYPAAPMGAGYPPSDPRVAQLVRPEIGSRVSSHQSTRSHKSHHSHEDGDEHHHHHHHHHHHDHKTRDIDSRPTMGDSVYWVWDSLKAAFSGKK